jgi:hypothetical protein
MDTKTATMISDDEARFRDEIEEPHCYPCAHDGIATHATQVSVWVDGDGATSGVQRPICDWCLAAESEGGPGYRLVDGDGTLEE